MMIKRLEHIGIAVKDIQKSNDLFADLLGYKRYKEEEVEDQHVKTSFFDANNTKIELVAATDDDSPIAQFIAKRGEGIHHLAFEVENILESMAEMKAKGYRLLNDTPKEGADNKLICFLHPKDTNGVLVELCQSVH